MTIDGFLQFLGLVVAVYALFGVVSRYRFRLLGWWLWVPTVAALAASVYLLLFDVLGAKCRADWCLVLQFQPGGTLTPNKLAFLVVLAWLAYVALLYRWKSIGTRHLPLLAGLVDRLVAEKRLPEVVDLIERHVDVISQCARRRFALQKLRDAIRWHGNPFANLIARASEPGPTRLQQLKGKVSGWALSALKPLEARLPKTDARQEAALRILRILYTNQPLVEFIALERSTFALRLMEVGSDDYDFGDRAFELMMAHPHSQLRRETMLNLSLTGYFYEIDPKNPLIFALFSDARRADKLQVWRPIGNYPLRLLERNIDDYRQTISASKPTEDELLAQDPTYIMIWFFDIMVRSAIRDGIQWHMWLFYYDILVDKLLKHMDRHHPDYDPDSEFPNFGYFLIYQIFDTYGEWLKASNHCQEDSPAVQFASTAASPDNGSILKSAALSMGRSLGYLVQSNADDRFISYIIEIVMRDYRDIGHVKNGKRIQELLRNSLISRGVAGKNMAYGERFKLCYKQIDHCMQFDTQDFNDALMTAYP